MPDIAWAPSFDARYGAGLDRALCLGGGGLYFIAWQVGYLKAAADAGVDVSKADRVVGTSAGSVVATSVTAGHLGRLHAQLSALSRFPAVLRMMAPSTSLQPSRQRALDAFIAATDAEPATVQEIGRAALAAVAPDPARLRASLATVLHVASWPSPVLHVTCVDAYTGERCVVTSESGIRPVRAAAASSAVPGLFPPQPVGDRRCMDGGVSGTGLHLDIVAGAARALVLSLRPPGTPAEPGMTAPGGDGDGELRSLVAAGTHVLVRSPGPVDRATLMSAESVPLALESGARQAGADLPALREFWS